MKLKDFLKVLKAIHISMCIGLFFLLLIFSVLKFTDDGSSEIDIQVSYIILAYGLLAIALSQILFKRFCTQVHTKPNIKDKAFMYRTSFIIQMAVLESAGIINAIFIFLSGRELHSFVALLILVFMIYKRPSLGDMEKMLYKDGIGTSAIRDENTII